mmetsp:Transcript_15992/g.45901  ORF Transcript_15992/g.45901 Transcript_15992/m.45901 type:complete len:88 (-) Transcript_15992:513-776(-)
MSASAQSRKRPRSALESPVGVDDTGNAALLLFGSSIPKSAVPVHVFRPAAEGPADGPASPPSSPSSPSKLYPELPGAFDVNGVQVEW